MSLTLLPSAGLPCTILGPSGPLLVPKENSSVGRSPSIDTWNYTGSPSFLTDAVRSVVSIENVLGSLRYGMSTVYFAVLCGCKTQSSLQSK